MLALESRSHASQQQQKSERVSDGVRALCVRSCVRACVCVCVRVCVCSRVVMAIAGGCASGVMHLTGMQGIVFYILLSAVVSACIWVKAARSIGAEHATLAAGGAWGAMEGAAQGALSYVLFWTYVSTISSSSLSLYIYIQIHTHRKRQDLEE